LPPPSGASLVASQPVNFLVSSSFSCLELALRAGGLHHLTDKEAALLVLARATFGQHWVTIVDTLHIHGPETELEMWNYNAINFRR
jgi:hypothetical protein